MPQLPQSDEEEVVDDVEKVEPSFAGVDGPSSGVSIGSNANRSGLRHRGVGGSGAATPRGGGAAAGSAYGGNRRRPANALQLRVRERVSERLDPASVRIMKRWLIMMGVTHGMKEDEVRRAQGAWASVQGPAATSSSRCAGSRNRARRLPAGGLGVTLVLSVLLSSCPTLQVNNIVRECDARLSHDPDYINRDTSFTAPHLLNRRALQQASLSASQASAGAGGGGGGGVPAMKRGSTLRRHTAAIQELVQDLPTMPEDRVPSHALAGLPAAAAAVVAAGELGVAVLVRSDGEGGISSGPEERAARGGRATPKLSRSMTAERQSTGSRPRTAGVSRAGTAERKAGGGSGAVSRVGTGERSSAYSRAGTAERTRGVSRAGTGERERTSAMSRVGTGDRTSAGTYRSSRRGGSGRTPAAAPSPAPSPFEAASAAMAVGGGYGGGLDEMEDLSEYDDATAVGPGPVSGGPSRRALTGLGPEDGGRTSGGSAARSGLGSAQASAPLPLTERHSGTSGVVGLLERLSHAVRSKVLGGMRSGGVSPRASNPGILAGDRGERGERWHGARVKVDLPPPPPSPYGAATPHGPYGLGARRSTPGADGSRRVSAGGASPHGAQSPGGYLNAAAGGPAGPGPSRMGRAPVPVRQDSWAMLVPSTDALRAAAAAAARQQQIMDDAYVRHRLQAWLHDSQVALRANSLTSAKPSPFAAPGTGPSGTGGGGCGGGGGTGAFSQQNSLQRRASEAASSSLLHTIAETAAGAQGGDDAGAAAAAPGSSVGGHAASCGGGASVAAAMSRVVSRGRDASSSNILPTLPSMQRRLTREASANAAGSHAAAAAGAAAGLADPGSGYGHDAGAGCEDSGPDPVTEQLRFSEGTRQRRLLLRAISRDRHLPGPGQLVAAGSLPRTGSRGAAAGAAAAEAAAAAAAAGQAGVEATSLAGGDSFATGPAIASGGGADAAASANASRALLQRPPLGLGMAGTSAADEANAALTQHLRRSFQRRHSMPSQDPDTLENVRVMLGVGALLNGSPVDGGSGFGISAAGGGGSGKALQPSVTVAGAAGRGYVLAGSSFAMRADGGGAARGGGHPAAADYATEPLLVLKAAVARLESLGLVAGAGRGSGAQRSRAGRGGGHVHSRLGEAPLEDGERILSGGTGHPHNGRTVSGRTDNDRTVSGRTDNDRTLSGRTDNGRTVSGRTGDGMSGGEEPVRYSLESAAGTSSIEGLGRGGAQYSGSGLADGRTSDSTRGDSLDAASAHASGSGAAGAPEPTPRSPRFWSELGGGPAAGRHASGEVETSVSGGGAGAGVGVVADRLLSRSRSGRRRSLLRRHSHSGSDYSPSRGASPSRMGPSRRVTAGTSSSAKPSSSAQLRMPLAPAPASGAVGAMSATEALRDQQFVSDRVPEIQPAYGNGGAGVRQSSAGGIGPGVTDAAAVADAAEHRRQALALHHVFGEQSGNFFRRSRTLPDNPDDAGVMAAVAAAAAAELHLGHGTAPAGRGRSGAGGVDEGDGPRVSGQDAPGPPRPPPLVPPPPLVIPVPAGATPAHRHNPAHAQGHATSVLTGGTRGTPASNVGTAGSRVSGPPSLAPSSASSFGAGQGVLLRGGSSLRRQAAAAAAVTAAHRPHGDEGERAAAYATAAAAAAEAAATPGSGASSHGARTPSTAALHDLAAALNRFHGQQPWAAEATVEEEHPAGAASASGPAGTTLPGVAQPHRGAASVAGEAVTTINPFFEAGPELEPERLTGVEERDFFGGDLFPVALFGNPLARVSAGSSRTSHTSRQLPMLSMLLPAEAAVAAAGGGAEGQGGGSRTASVQSIPPASQLAAAAAVAGQLAALRQAQEGGGSGVVGVDSTGFYSKSPSGRSAATAATDPTPLPSDQLLLMLEAEVAAAALNAASGGVAGNGGRTAAAVAAVLAGGGGPSRDGATINGAAARGHSAGGAGAAAGHEAQQGSGSGMAPASQLSPSALAPSPFAKSLSGRSPETGPPAWEAPAPRGGAAEGAGTGAGAAPTNGHEATAAPPAEKLRAMALMAAAATALAARRGAADSAESPLRARGGKPPVPGLPPTASLSVRVEGMLRAELEAPSGLAPASPSVASLPGEQQHNQQARHFVRQPSPSQPSGPVAEATEVALASVLPRQPGSGSSGHGQRSVGATAAGVGAIDGVDGETLDVNIVTAGAVQLAPAPPGTEGATASDSGTCARALGTARISMRGSALLSASASAHGGGSLHSPAYSTGVPPHGSLASSVSSFGTVLLPMPPAATQHAGIGAGGAQDGAASSLGIASASASHETGGPLASGTHAGVNTTAELRGPAAAGVPVSGAGPTAAPAAGGGARGWAERVARLPLPHGPATGEGGAAAGGASARSAAVQHLLRGLLVSALRRRTEAAGAEPPAQVQQPQEGPGPAAARRGGAPGPVCESRVDDESDSLPGGGSPAPHLSRTSVPGSVAAPATLDSPGLASGGSPIATPFTRLSGFNTDLTITPPAHSVTAVPGPGAAAMQASAAMGSAPGFGSTAKDRSAGAAAGGGGFAEHAVHSSGGSIYGSGGITGSSSAAAAAAAATGPRRGFLPPRLQVLDGHGGHRQGPGSAHDAPRSPRGGSPLGPLANTGAASAGPLPGGGAPAAYSSYGNSGYGNNSMYGTNNSGYSGYGGLGSGQGTGTTSTPRVSAPGNTGGAGGGGGPGRRGNAPPGAGSRRPPPLRTVSSRRRTDRDHYTSHGSRTLSPGRRTAAVATDTWTPRDVARARAAGGPRDAAEMEAALYGELCTAPVRSFPWGHSPVAMRYVLTYCTSCKLTPSIQPLPQRPCNWPWGVTPSSAPLASGCPWPQPRARSPAKTPAAAAAAPHSLTPTRWARLAAIRRTACSPAPPLPLPPRTLPAVASSAARHGPPAS